MSLPKDFVTHSMNTTQLTEKREDKRMAVLILIDDLLENTYGK